MEKMKCYVLLSEDKKKELNKDFSLTFGKLLKEARESRGVTARDLAFLSGIDPSNICRIEKGKHVCSVRVFSRLLYCLGFGSIGVCG